MKYVLSLLTTLCLAVLVTSASQAAIVGSTTFNAPNDAFSDQNQVIDASAFPFDYSLTTNLTDNYKAVLTDETGTFDSLSLEWLGLQPPVSAMGTTVSLTQYLTAGASPNPVVRVDGSGTGTFDLTVTALAAPIPGAAILLVSGIGMVGYAAYRHRNTDRATAQA